MFAIWNNFWGLIREDDDGVYKTHIYGFSSDKKQYPVEENIPDIGACYGFVAKGRVFVNAINGAGIQTIRAGHFFVTSGGANIMFPSDEPFAVVVNQAIGYRGLNISGGPIERLGRLQYIDRCSDTCLIPPMLLGDPCFNHLHFPKGIDQTMHTHPSLRSGIIARGRGVCVTPNGEYLLVPGHIFSIPKDAHHKFRTEDETMDVIAFHPDSDWGPTHETHPMINRTWVDGVKMDNTKGIHTTAEFIKGRQ